jgi:PAP2 superfamily
MTPPAGPARGSLAESASSSAGTPGRARRLASAIHAHARRRQAGLRELGLALAVYLFYVSARWLAAGSYTTALHHARELWAVEHRLRLAIEPDVQRAFLHSAWLPAFNALYLSAQNLVVPAALLVTYRLDRAVYLRLRRTLIAAWLMAVPIYALFPTAPPRLAHLGIADTVSAGTGVQLTSETTTLFFNPFAAVPSLHVGFAFAIGIALAAITRRPLLRLLALAWGPAIVLTVVVTGNHFVFDAGAGLVVTGVAFIVAGRPARALADARSRARPCVTPLPSAVS